MELGFAFFGLGKRDLLHWDLITGNGMGNFKNGNGISLFSVNRDIESVIFTTTKFVLPGQWLQSPEVHCNFPLCNLKFVSFTKFWIITLRTGGVIRVGHEGAKALAVKLPAYKSCLLTAS